MKTKLLNSCVRFEHMNQSATRTHKSNLVKSRTNIGTNKSTKYYNQNYY